MWRQHPVQPTDPDPLDGPEAQCFRAHFRRLTLDQAPPADGWAKLADRLQREPVAPPPKPAWPGLPLAGWQQVHRIGFAFVPMLLVGWLTFYLNVLPLVDTGEPFDYTQTAPPVVREPGDISAEREATVEPRAVREWRQARVLAYTEALEAIDSSDTMPAAARGQSSRTIGGAVSPHDLIPGVQRDAINPFGKRPRPAVGEPKLPARPGLFRFTTA